MPVMSRCRQPALAEPYSRRHSLIHCLLLLPKRRTSCGGAVTSKIAFEETGEMVKLEDGGERG
jgi:hypothetical protein